MRSALFVIDFQNAMLDGTPVYQADIVLERIAALIARARAANAPVIYIQHDVADTEWARGSPGWEFPAAIAPRPHDHVSAKNSSDAFRNPALHPHLIERGIEQVFVCGFATEFCIDTNVRRLAGLGLATVVVTDAHTTRDRPHMRAPHIIEHHNWIWSEMASPGVSLSLRAADAVRFEA